MSKVAFGEYKREANFALRVFAHRLKLSPQLASDTHVKEVHFVAFSPDSIVGLAGVDKGRESGLLSHFPS